MKSKTTSRALLSSVLALVLCVTMLIGSTFAWFTDTATTGVNTIKAGTLDVDLVDADGNSLVGQTLEFIKPDGVDEEVLWEPGCTYALPDVFVKNNGDLAVTFTVTISGINGTDKLNEAIEWTIKLPDGGLLPAKATSGAIQISGHMKEDAGNEYQGLEIKDVSITVNATQADYENDSNGNDYDVDAAETLKPAPEPFEIDKENRVITINSATAFLDLAKGATAFGLGINDYPDAYTVKLSQDLSMNGATLTAPISVWWSYFDGQNKTISDINVNTDNQWAGLFIPASSENTLNIKDLKVDNVHVVSTNTEGNAGVVTGYSANAVIKNVSVTNSSVSGAERMGGIVGQLNGTITGCMVSNTTIDGGSKVGGIVGDLFAEGADASISDCHVDTITITSTGSAVGSIVGRIRQPSGATTFTASTCSAEKVTGPSVMYGVNLDNACTIN